MPPFVDIKFNKFYFYFLELAISRKMDFQREMAHAEGVPVKKLRYFFMFLVVAVVIVSSRVVGVLLVTSMLIVPGAVGSLASRSMFGITIVSIATALVSSLIGLSISNSYDVPPGPVIVLTGFLMFLEPTSPNIEKNHLFSVKNEFLQNKIIVFCAFP